MCQVNEALLIVDYLLSVTAQVLYGHSLVPSICWYMYKRGHHGIRWQLSACANSVHQALFLLPLLHAWERG